MTLESKDSSWICRSDVVKLDSMVARCGEESLIRRNAKAIHL